MKMIPFYALWIVVILALIIYLVNRQESADLAQQDPSILALRQSASKINSTTQQPPQPVAEKTNPVAAPEDATDNSTEQNNPQPTNTAQISLQAKKHVWVEVKSVSSGESLFTGFLETGDSHTFSDKEGLRVRAGSGGNVSVTWAGKTEDLGPLGKISEKAFINPHIKTAQTKAKPEEISESSTDRSSQSTTQPSKKTASEKPAASKKSIAASVHKPHLANQTEESAYRKHTSSEGQDSTNKSIEVPYRY